LDDENPQHLPQQDFEHIQATAYMCDVLGSVLGWDMEYVEDSCGRRIRKCAYVSVVAPNPGINS
jgi:hypothetical protein